MSTVEVVQVAILFSMVFMLAVAIALGIGLLAHVGQSVQKSLFPWVFVAMGVGMIWVPVAGQRDLSAGLVQFIATGEEFGTALWFSRVLTVLVMGLCAARLLAWAFGEHRKVYPGLPLYASLLLLLATHYYVAGAFGSKPHFSHQFIYPVVLFTTGYVVANTELQRCIRFAKGALFAFLLAGAVAAVIKPSLALQVGYSGIFPGLDFRYWGLGAHANAVGALALLFLLLIWNQPFSPRWVQWLAVILGAVSLGLTQSKTAWAGGVVALAVMGVVRFRPVLAASWRSGRPALTVVGLLATVVVLAILISLVLMHPETERAWHGFKSTNASVHIMTLTGRTRIWELAFADWQRNPVFGYGPTWGDLRYRLAVGLPAAVHAHNQFVHSLAAAGVLGFLSAVAYLVILMRYALRGAKLSGGLTVGLVGMLFTRAMTEVPLALNSWSGAEVYVQLVTFLVVIGYGIPHIRPTRVPRYQGTRMMQTAGRPSAAVDLGGRAEELRL